MRHILTGNIGNETQMCLDNWVIKIWPAASTTFTSAYLAFHATKTHVCKTCTDFIKPFDICFELKSFL